MAESETAGSEESAPPGWLGGTSLLRDAGRWRQLARTSAADLPGMKQAVLRLRGEFAGLDLGTSIRTLAALAEGSDLLARLVQADIEAVLLYEAAGEAVPAEVMAVFPPERGALRAAATSVDGSWRLHGTQVRTFHPGSVDRVLVVAATDEGDRVFSVSTTAPGVVRAEAPRGPVATVHPHRPVTFADVPATPVGSAGWWAHHRASFDGLLRDAACWFGSCVWLCRAVESTLREQQQMDAADLLRVGRVDVWVYSARTAMRDAVPIVEADPTSRAAELAARRVVAVTATTVDKVIRLVAMLSDSRVSYRGVPVPTRVAELQVALRRFDVDANVRAVGGLVADGVSIRTVPG